MMKLLLCALWISSAIAAVVGQTNEWQCSAPDRDGYTYFPDVPADRYHISDAEIATHTRSFYIYSTMPEQSCNGTIVGADFCYNLENETDTETRRVFQVIKFEQTGDIFIPDINYTAQTFSAAPLDRTNCVSQSSGRGLLCCQRMTITSDMLRLEGKQLVFGILAQNLDLLDYPLLNFGVQLKQFLVQAYRVDFDRLSSPDNVFANTYDSSNTNAVIANLPVIRFVIEPEDDLTDLDTTEAVCNTNTIIGSFSAVLLVETTILITVMVALIIVVVNHSKLKRNGVQAKTVSRQYTRQSSSNESTTPGGQSTTKYSRPRVPPPPKPLYVNSSMEGIRSLPAALTTSNRDEEYGYVEPNEVMLPPHY